MVVKCECGHMLEEHGYQCCPECGGEACEAEGCTCKDYLPVMTGTVRKPPVLMCESCGEYKPDVENTYDPFVKEVNNREVFINLCKVCYEKRCQDI